MARPGLDASVVREFLGQTLGVRIEELRELAGGEWSQAFSFVAARRPQIVRFGAVPDDFRLDRFAERFGGPALPVPRVTRIGEAFDGWYALSERHVGEFLEGGDEVRMRRLLPALFAALDAMREADTSATSGYGAWRPDGSGAYASWREALLDVAADHPGDRIHGWWSRLTSAPGAEGTFLAGLVRLEEMIGRAPELRCVIHSDLIHGNVLVDGDEITAVFDWGCAMYGDFLYDLAWLTFWSPWHPELRDIDLRGLAQAHYDAIGLDVPDFEPRMRICEVHIGLAAQAYDAFAERWEDLEAAGRRTLQCGGDAG